MREALVIKLEPLGITDVIILALLFIYRYAVKSRNINGTLKKSDMEIIYEYLIRRRYLF